MKAVTVTTQNGQSWTTDINGTNKNITEYFMYRYFDVGVFPVEDMQKVIKVEIDV
tara:strand:- start:640 stop:804 length:165 start_codon:yes stop_codon:yes gene_type:complete